MIRHFHQGVNVAEILEEFKPDLVVELGIGFGYFATALLVLSTKKEVPFKLVSVSESIECPIPYMPAPLAQNFCYASGLTWEVLERWDENKGIIAFKDKIDVCIVDSDHNYYTVKKEVDALYPLLSDRCLVFFHDTATSSTVTGHYANAGKFSNGRLYPEEEIRKTLDIHFKRAIEEFLEAHPDFKVIRESPDHEGCIVIARNFKLKEKEAV